MENDTCKFLYNNSHCFHKQYFIKAIRQNPKTDYIKPSRRKKYLQQKKRENKIQIYSTK